MAGAFKQVVDPRVSRRKFAGELDRFREIEEVWRNRGVFLLEADFPTMVFHFATPQLIPPVLMFGARFDFTDFDHSPPSVKLINPFTREVYSWEELPTRLPKRLPVAKNALDSAPIQLQAVMQVHKGSEPFVCARGVREYHSHPFHTGDSWFLQRDVGALGRILGILYTHGLRPATAFRLLVNATRLEIASDPQRIPIGGSIHDEEE